MDKEALDRIRKAYSCGLKVQIWFNGYWKDFDIQDYSMYAEPFSENRQYRIVGSDYADIAEKRIVELENENAELLCQKNRNKSCYSCANATKRCFRNEIGCPCQKYKSYKDENAELKDKNKALEQYADLADAKVDEVKGNLTKAKELIKEFMRISVASVEEYEPEFSELIEKAEQFLKDEKVK